MANKRFFTNTYITSSGRHNYLRADYLEDPLFTSFTFDIDYISSPLFYTINYSDYGYPNVKEIENSLNKMYADNMSNIDQGYDILPLLSANFLDEKKLGFGLQQNIYTDLPLYGATEYIYMVDKRNGNGSQNDVRYDNSGSADNGGYKSYKLGDSVKEVVSESDAIWAKKQNEQAQEQINECKKILEDQSVKNEHNENFQLMNAALEACEQVTEKVYGEDLNESQVQKKIKTYQEINNKFENLKRDICNWINGELSAIKSKAISIYSGNNCVKKIMSYDVSKLSNGDHDEELKTTYGKNFKEEHIYGDDNSYLSQSLKLFNKYVSGKADSYFTGDDESLLVWNSNDELYIRGTKLDNKFKDRLLDPDLEIKDVKVQIRLFAEPPEWVLGICDHLGHFDDEYRKLAETAVLELFRYKCDIDDSFNEFSSQKIKDNNDKLDEYERSLESIRTELYGFEEGQVCDMSNPTPYSKYGEYLSAKEKYENDAYTQAENAQKIASSGLFYIKSDYNQQDTSSENSKEYVPSHIEQEVEKSNDIIIPQTVIDMLGFISGMKKMTTEYPYIIQGITGLDKAYDNHYGIKDPFMGSGDNKITLTCLESLDLRVSSMFNRYFNAVYDRQYRRERVPVNIRRFNCMVYVHDVRNFVTNYSGEYENRIIELADMYHSVIEFRFYDCEIVPEETGNIFNDISNEAPSEMKKTNFTFTYGNCAINFIPQSEVVAYRSK